MPKDMYHMRFPKNYVFGANVMDYCAKYLLPLGRNFLFLLGCGPVSDVVEKKIRDSFSSGQNAGEFSISFVNVEGMTPTHKNFERLAEQVTEAGAEVVIGIGGGRALDFARGQGIHTRTKICLFPTVAATNAAGTRLFVVFSDDTGKQVEAIRMTDDACDLLLVDTSLIVKAPAHTLAAGIGDCLASYYECRLTANLHYSGFMQTKMGWDAYEDGARILREKGIQAVKAAEAGHASNAFIDVAEQIVFGNGVWGGNTYSGMGLPHLIADDTLLFLETEEKRFMHGQLAGYGVLPLMVQADCPLEEMYSYADFCLHTGIPVNFQQLGIDGMDEKELYRRCVLSMDSIVLKMTKMQFRPEDIYCNMRTADKIISSWMERR